MNDAQSFGISMLLLAIWFQGIDGAATISAWVCSIGASISVAGSIMRSLAQMAESKKRE